MGLFKYVTGMDIGEEHERIRGLQMKRARGKYKASEWITYERLRHNFRDRICRVAISGGVYLMLHLALTKQYKEAVILAPLLGSTVALNLVYDHQRRDVLAELLEREASRVEKK